MLSIYNIPDSQISLKWREEYVSEGINKKGVVENFGIIRGFEPIPTAVAGQLIFGYDTQSFDSVARVRSTSDRMYSITYATDSAVTVNLPAATGRYYLAVRATYTIAGTTSAEIVAYTDAEVNAGLFVIEGAAILCMVDYQAVGVIDSKWIVFAGNTTSGGYWSRSYPEISGSSRGDSGRSIMFQSDFAFPASWSISGSPILEYEADLENYRMGSSSLRVFNTTGLAKNITLTKNDYLSTWSKNKAGGYSNRISVDLWYRTDAGFIATGDCGVDLQIGYHNGTSMVSTYASTIAADLVTFNWITAVSTGWRKLQWEIPEAALASLGTIRWVKPVIKANLSNGEIFFNRLRVYQLTPPELYGAEDVNRPSLEELVASAVKLVLTRTAGNTEQDGDVIKTNGTFVGTTNTWGTTFPPDKRNIVSDGNNAVGTQNEWNLYGDPSRTRGRSKKTLNSVDFNLVDGRQELDSNSWLRSTNPLAVPGGYLASYYGSFMGTAPIISDGITVVIGATALSLDLDNDPISGLSLTPDQYIVSFSYDWEIGSMSCMEPIVGYMNKRTLNRIYVRFFAADGTTITTGSADAGRIRFNLMVFRPKIIPLFP